MNGPTGQAAAIFAELVILGITIRAIGNDLHLEPACKLPPELRHRVAAHKRELIAALRQQSGEAGEGSGLPCVPQRHQRFLMAQNELRKRGFRALADKPEAVLAVLDVAEKISAKQPATAEKPKSTPRT